MHGAYCTLHLAVSHFAKALRSTPTAAEMEEGYNLTNIVENNHEESIEESKGDFKPNDTWGKALALVSLVSFQIILVFHFLDNARFENPHRHRPFGFNSADVRVFPSTIFKLSQRLNGAALMM
jgi:hypothetical protein